MEVPIVGPGVRKALPGGYSSTFVIGDAQVLEWYGEGMGEQLVVPAGEAAKELRVAERLWGELLERGADRGFPLVAQPDVCFLGIRNRAGSCSHGTVF